MGKHFLDYRKKKSFKEEAINENSTVFKILV
jgi:hypothetical protein